MRWSILFVCMAIMMSSVTVIYAKYYGQVGQDAYLNEHIFKSKRGGVFVDIGAHDGISFSNTYFFEKELDWSGICIEPHPDCFEKLIKHRTSRCYQVCLGAYEGEVAFLKINGYPQMLSGVLSCYDPQHLARIERELEIYGGTAEIIQLPMKKLSSILADMNYSYIDFVSLDVEGAELEVLHGIDFSQVSIKYILIERNYKNSWEPIVAFLQERGYKSIYSFDFDELFELQG